MQLVDVETRRSFPGHVRPRTGQWPRATVATFVYARLQNFAAVCETLDAEELAAFIAEARHVLSDPVIKLGGQIAQRRADSILAVFTSQSETSKPDHAQRGLHAAILAVYETVELAKRTALRPSTGVAPGLSLSVGVHLGDATIKPRSGGSQDMVHAVGEAAEMARLLELSATDLHWSIATSSRTLLAAAGRAAPGRVGSVRPPDDAFIDVVEVAGLIPRPGSTTPPQTYALMREAIMRNAVRPQASAISFGTGSAAAAHFVIEGYRNLRRIGEGGMSEIYLAEPQSGGAPQVLKIMRVDRGFEADGLQRFIQEFALLSQIDHPHVARIHRQDFCAGQAYIAMEFFPGGDLRARMKDGLDAPAAISYLAQIASGFEAVHAAGVVHCDLKPDNLMFRDDGTLVLADFGIAKHMTMLIMDTDHGDIVGTPSYLSPEQARGLPVDARSDLYSLGVLAYEMLVGQRPYSAASTAQLLDMHINAPIPRLPAEFSALQPVLDRLMAKDREQRYPSAKALLDDLRLLAAVMSTP
jgi:serine/threonine-protein kinase PpkA